MGDSCIPQNYLVGLGIEEPSLLNTDLSQCLIALFGDKISQEEKVPIRFFILNSKKHN